MGLWRSKKHLDPLGSAIEPQGFRGDILSGGSLSGIDAGGSQNQDPVRRCSLRASQATHDYLDSTADLFEP